MDGPYTTVATAPTEMSTYDQETLRLEKTGRRIGMVSKMLALGIRVLNFLAQSVVYISL
jgi:hypothetical protein